MRAAVAGLAGAAGLGLALAGCGGGTHAAATVSPPAASAPATVQSGHAAVAIRNFQFQPGGITVRVGTRVTWTQDDASVHTVTAAGVFASGPLPQGASYSHTFTTPGTYRYVCTIHMYMTGTVTVVS